MELVQFTTRAQVAALHNADSSIVFYDTSTHAPYAQDFLYVRDASEFSPFQIVQPKIPIPGRSERSDTVEGVWQGLKMIGGEIDPSYFHGKGRRRYGKVDGNSYHEKRIGYVEARTEIYAPSYKFMIEKCIDPSTLEKMYALARAGVKQFFFDVDENADVHNKSSPLAHSSLLVAIINETLLMDDSINRNQSDAHSARCK